MRQLQFTYCFQSEWLKKQHSLASWLVYVGAFLSPVVITIARFVRRDTLATMSVSDRFWTMLWSNSWESMAVFVLPPGIVLVTTLITQLEHRDNTWKQLHTTPHHLATLFFAKFTVIVVMLVQCFAMFNIGVYLSGVVPCLLTPGVPYPQATIPYSFLLKDNLLYFLDVLPILAFQYLVGLHAKNFGVSVAGGIGLWICSLAAIHWKYGYLVPYTYPIYHYGQAQGKMLTDLSVHYFALGYLVIFMAAGCLSYVVKSVKG